MTFCTQSAQLFITAATNPIVSNRNSDALHSIKPATTGINVNMTGVAVRSFKMRRANTTVKAGAVAFMVSTKETGTCSNAMRPNTTVAPRNSPTMDISRMK
eukprot:scaffold343932_cov109-Cyclotella_meneghiniana.AAC.1